MHQSFDAPNRRTATGFRRRAFLPLIAVAAMLGTLLGAGCLRSERPLFDYGPNGDKIQVKRIARVSQGGTFIRVGKTAYDHNEHGVEASGPEEQAILDEFGQPDYIRRPYRSTRGDQVSDWAYLKHNKLYQMVYHRVVFDGPLSDKDRVLIQYGYPDEHLLQDDELGRKRETFIYHNEWDTRQKYFSFSDEAMVMGKTAY